MIIVVGRFRLPPEQVESARPLMDQVISASLQEAGCLGYSYAEDLREPGLFRVCEAWETIETLKAHFDTPHIQQWQMEREALGFHDREVMAFEAGVPLSL